MLELAGAIELTRLVLRAMAIYKNNDELVMKTGKKDKETYEQIS